MVITGVIAMGCRCFLGFIAEIVVGINIGIIGARIGGIVFWGQSNCSRCNLSHETS